MNVSHSLCTVSPPRLCLLSLPAFLPGCIGSLLFLILLSLHATSSHPDRSRKPHHIVAKTVPVVLTSAPLKAFSSASAINGAACSFRCHITLWPIMFPVYTFYLSFCNYSSGHLGDRRDNIHCYLLISKTRYWWLVIPSR
jgi:hypothetical protein